MYLLFEGDLCCVFNINKSKKGLQHRVEHLIERFGVNPNKRDTSDNTPLYYAALCGHSSIILYLLSHGAECMTRLLCWLWWLLWWLWCGDGGVVLTEPNVCIVDMHTLDGQRTYLGALTDNSRIILKYKL